MADTRGRVIAAPAGVGKTRYCAGHPGVADLDTMPYRFGARAVAETREDRAGQAAAAAPAVRDEGWRTRYLADARTLLKAGYDVCMATDTAVVTILYLEDYEVTVVTPDRGLRLEYARRFCARGNDEKFVHIHTAPANWEHDCAQRLGLPCARRVVLGEGAYLSGVPGLPAGEHAPAPPWRDCLR